MYSNEDLLKHTNQLMKDFRLTRITAKQKAREMSSGRYNITTTNTCVGKSSQSSTLCVVSDIPNVPVAKPVDYTKNWCNSQPCKPSLKEEAIPMNNEHDTLRHERNYLDSRLWSIVHDREQKLNKQFFISDDDAPKTMKEMVERIKEGKFTLAKRQTDVQDESDKDDSYVFCSWDLRGIRWRDPNNKPDKDGHKAAMKLLEKRIDKVRDSIRIKTPVEALVDLQAFENEDS